MRLGPKIGAVALSKWRRTVKPAGHRASLRALAALGSAQRVTKSAPPPSVWPRQVTPLDAPMPAPKRLRAWLQGVDHAFVVISGSSLPELPSTITVDGIERTLVVLPLDSGWAAKLSQPRVAALLQAADAAVDVPLAIPLAIPTLTDTELCHRQRISDLVANAASARLEQLPAEPPSPASSAIHFVDRPRTIVVASHDLKFAHGLLESLNADGHRVLIDQWQGHSRHDPGRSSQLLSEADVVFCEWGLGNAVWYTKHAKVPVVVRIHAQELRTWTLQAMRQPAAAICVGPYTARQVARETGWSPDRIHVVPNAVQMPDVDAAKASSARFTLGFVGVSPRMKRLDLVLDVLRALREAEPRFSLSVKGHRPEELAWVWDRDDERRYFEALYKRIEHDPLLVDAVHFDGFDADLTTWWQGVGHAISTSDHESFHSTLPDGAAHGCVPTSLAWLGADELYPRSWIVPSVDDMAARILGVSADETMWKEEAERAERFVRSRFAAAHVEDRLKALILNPPTGA